MVSALICKLTNAKMKVSQRIMESVSVLDDDEDDDDEDESTQMNKVMHSLFYFEHSDARNAMLL